MRKLLSTNLGIFPGLAKTAEIADSLLLSKSHKAEFINQLILYDQIFIPTSNLAIIPVLRNWLGENFFDLFVKENIIVLIRHDHWISYVGNGGGLGFHQILPGDNKEDINIALAAHLPLEKVLPSIIANTTPSSSPQRFSQLESLLSEKIISIPIENYKQNLRHETYTDIIKSKFLRSFFLLKHPNGTSLDRLSGIKPNQVVVYCPHLPANQYNNPEIRTVLDIAFQNFILILGSELHVTDIQATDTTLNVCKAKGERFSFDEERLNQFLSIFKVEGIPSIGDAFVSGIIEIPDVIRIRESKQTLKFRTWLEKNLQDNPTEILQEYIDSLNQFSWLKSIPVNFFKIGVQTTIDWVAKQFGDPGFTSTIFSIADSFLFEKWANTSSPRLFINEVKNIILSKEQQSPSIPIPSRLRNKLCTCGSGKKFKKCCGK